MFKTLQSLAVGLIMLGLLSLTASDLAAHPHVFITQKIEAVFDSQGLAGIKVFWKFDDMFASMISEDYDSNGNGQLELAEVSKIEQEAFGYIAKDSYFTFITIDKKPFKVTQVADFEAVLQDQRLEYHFFIPCPIRATASISKVSVATYDPSYYSAIFFGKDGAALKGAAPYEVTTAIREDPDTTIYYDMIHPWTLFLEFSLKP